MAEMEVLNVNCDCATDGSCDCDISQLHFACNRNKTEVFPTLPETGVEGTTYLIGDNATGYTEYVWNGAAFVEMGTAAGSLIRVMTYDELGVAKLGTATVITRGGVVGLDNDNRLMVPVASYFQYGCVRLGSRFKAKNSGEFIVGIGVSGNAATEGELAFNLAEYQPGTEDLDDRPLGALRYRQKPGTSVAEGNMEYEMYVCTGDYSQLGVVKMLGSLNGYTEDEINACRETHAASVGLVLDGLDSFCEGFFKDARIQGYFDAWALGKDLATQIWVDDEKRESLLGKVSESVLGSSVISEAINAKTEELIGVWLNTTVTPEYIDGLFSERVLAKVSELVEANWTNKLDATIAEHTAQEVGVQLEAGIAEWFSKKENVRAVSEIVVEAVSDEITANAANAAVEYTKGVFSGENKMNVDGNEVRFDEWVSSEIQKLMDNQTNGFEAKIQEVRAFAANRTFISDVLWDGGDERSLNVELGDTSSYDVLVVQYKDHWGNDASCSLDLNVARAIFPSQLYVATGATNGSNIDTKYGANDLTPCVKLDLSTGIVSWYSYGAYAGHRGIFKVTGLRGMKA